MSSEPWITPDDVAAYIDYPDASDENIVGSTAAVKAAVERRRSDLFRGDPPAFEPGDDVRRGAIMWAALMFQSRNAPSGYSGYGDDTQLLDTLGARRAEVMRLLGWRRPVAT